MKKILVPVDFSEYSENAIRMAGYFAGIKGMAVKVLHILEEPGNFNLGINIPFISDDKSKDYSPEQIQSINEHFRKLALTYLPNNPDNEVEVRKVQGSATSEILSEDCDVIIMGRRRPENREPLWSGTIAEKVIRLSAYPVITVGELPLDYKIKNIAFASDFEEEDIKPALLRVLDLTQIFDADLHLVYVQLNRNYLNNKKTETKVKDLIDKYNLADYDLNIYVADSEEEGIARYTEEFNTDLLVMCTHGRTGLSHFFKQSVSENISAYGSVPVLTYNINKKKIDRSTQPISRVVVKEKKKETKKF